MLMLALWASTLTFPGGDIKELAQSLATWSERPTVALVEATPMARTAGAWSEEGFGARKIRGFQIQGLSGVGDGKDLRRLLRIKAGVELKSGEVLALWSTAWEPSTVSQDEPRNPLPTGWRLADPAHVRISGGHVTFDMKPREAIRLKELRELNWSRPIKAHWLIDKVWLAFVGKDVPERSILEAIATAAGGALTISTDEYNIDIDPTAMRLRTQALVSRCAPPTNADEVKQASYDVLRESWNFLDDATIRDLYSGPYRAASRDVPVGTPLHTAILRHCAAFRRYAVDKPNALRLLDRVDWSKPPRIMVNQGIGASGAWRQTGGGSVVF